MHYYEDGQAEDEGSNLIWKTRTQFFPDITCFTDIKYHMIICYYIQLIIRLNCCYLN